MVQTQLSKKSLLFFFMHNTLESLDCYHRQTRSSDREDNLLSLACLELLPDYREASLILETTRTATSSCQSRSYEIYCVNFCCTCCSLLWADSSPATSVLPTSLARHSSTSSCGSKRNSVIMKDCAVDIEQAKTKNREKEDCANSVCMLIFIVIRLR